MPKSSTLCQLN